MICVLPAVGIELGLCGQREVEQGVDFLFHSLGMLQLDTKQFAEAKKVFSAGVGLFPNHSHMLLGRVPLYTYYASRFYFATLAGLALACMRLGQHAQARERFRMSVDCDSQHLHAWQSWAVAEKQLGNVELARILFREGLRHGPLHGALWQGYAVMEMQQGSVEIARTLFAEGIRRAPQHAQSYQVKSQAHMLSLSLCCDPIHLPSIHRRGLRVKFVVLSRRGHAWKSVRVSCSAPGPSFGR